MPDVPGLPEVSELPELPAVPDEPDMPVLPDLPDVPLVPVAEPAPDPMSDDEPDIDLVPPRSADEQAAIRKTHAKGMIHLVIESSVKNIKEQHAETQAHRDIACSRTW